MDNNFGILIKAILDSSSIGKADVAEVQKVIDRYSVNLTADLNKEELLKTVKRIVPEIEADLKRISNVDIKINDKQLITAVNQVIKNNQHLQQELDKTVQKASRIRLSVDDGSYLTKIDKLQANFEKYGLSVDEAKTKVTDLRNILSTMKSSSGEQLLSEADKFDSKMKAVKVQLDQTKLSYDKLVQPAPSDQIARTLNRTQDLLNKNTRATKEVRQEWETYVTQLKNGGSMSVGKLNEIKSALTSTESQMRSLGKLGKSLKDQFKESANSFTQWISVSSLIMGAVYKVKTAVSELKGINNILTEISKTSNLAKQDLKELGNESFGKASDYGKTASDYLANVQEMSQSGFYGEKGEKLAEQAILAQAAGDMVSDVAKKYIIATDAAYKYNGDAENINKVLDGQNSITNRNSVALTDMALAMSEAGTTAAAYRVDIEDLSAMIGTMEAVTKSGGSEVGNSIKSILINLQNITSSKIVDTLETANASMTELVDGTEKLRDPISILRDLASTFNSLDKADPLRAEILTNIGGKYQANKLSALLQNMDKFDKMLVDYSDGSGSAMEEAMKSANNWEGSLNKLRNTWTGTINNIADSDAIIVAINGLNGLLSVVKDLTSALGSFGTISTIAGGIFGAKNVGRAKCSLARICLQ